jgi:phosphatidylglycerophosphate synthase
VSRAAGLKSGYTQGARRIASRSMLGLARTRVTPDALTTSGVALCAAAAVLVFFENRDELLFYWLGAAVFVVGSILDILDGALARTSGKGTPFGAFLDSTTDRVSEGVVLGAIALVFARHHDLVGVGLAFAAVAGSFLVSYARARAEALGLRGDVGIGSRAERVRSCGRSASSPRRRGSPSASASGASGRSYVARVHSICAMVLALRC